MAEVRIRVGHSADPDDAFMFWAIEAGRVDTRGLELEQVVSDIETLNQWAVEGRLEVTAISMGAYPSVADRYVLLPHGASMGFGYGPVVVTREPLDRRRLRDAEIVIPGRLTTAYLVLRLALGENVKVRELPFDRILDEVASGRADAGLLIHEGQLTYAGAGLHKALDLGEWWLGETGLPLPLGVNAARRDLGERSRPTSPRCCRRRSAPASSTATRRLRTPSSSGAGSTARPPTASSRCTSTSSPPTTARRGAERWTSCFDGPARA